MLALFLLAPAGAARAQSITVVSWGGSYARASRPRAIYYYAPYEKTIYRKLRGKYPDVCSADDCRATRVLRDALQNMA